MTLRESRRPPGSERLPPHALERVADLRAHQLFTSDLSVNEFLLVREVGYEPCGLVMGSSIHGIAPDLPDVGHGEPGAEAVEMTRALEEARSLAMARMDAEARELGADGVVGVRLRVNLSTDPARLDWRRFRIWRRWSRRAGFRRQQPPSVLVPSGWEPTWEETARVQWRFYAEQLGWRALPQAPWDVPPSGAVYAIGTSVAEFIAVGTAVRHTGAEPRTVGSAPFHSALDGQDFWLLLRSGYRPVGFVMGNCVYYVPPNLIRARDTRNVELSEYTHALYDARERAMERLEADAEALGATGVVGVTMSERQHSWRRNPRAVGNAALESGELIELLVMGTAVVPQACPDPVVAPRLVISANDATLGPRGE